MSRHTFPRRVADLVSTFFESLGDASKPTILLRSPKELRDEFASAGIPFSLEKNNTPMPEDKLLEACEQTLKYSVRTGHPLFNNQLYARGDPVGTAADFVVTVANTNVITYEVAPVFTLYEQEVLKKLCGTIGIRYATSNDGLLNPGGSLSNMYGMHLARHRFDPTLKARGAAGGPRLVAYTSAESHYSYLKSVSVLGIGTDNLVKVACREDGSMDPEALVAAIEGSLAQGHTPFFVGSTAGTTVAGAFDPFIRINSICSKYRLWHHIDACWGGAAMFSSQYKYLMDGMDDSDSLAWNPHKLLGMPLQCSLFVTRHANALSACNSSKAEYLFQQDKQNADMDIGDKTIMCGRKADAFKLWLAWKAYGDSGIDDIVTKSGDMCKYAVSKMENDKERRFSILRAPQFANVCFFYWPKRLRPTNGSTVDVRQVEKGTPLWQDLDSIAPQIKARMQQHGAAMVGFQPHLHWPNHWRLVFPSMASVSVEHVDRVIESIDEYGRDL